MVDLSQIAVPVAVLVSLIAIWDSVHAVADGDVEVLVVFGEVRQVLEPGVYFVPPFVSATYPVDLETMQYETSRGRASVPAEFRDRLELIRSDRATTDERRR